MSRFTKKDKDGNYYVNTSDMGGYATRYENGSISELNGEMVDTLAHYENLAEQKHLVELPCAIDDMVYEIMREDDGFTVRPRTMKTLTNIVSLMEHGAWGKTIFTDKAMANEACEKMKLENKGICSATTVARYIINKCVHDGHPVGQITLQNLLYLCQRQYLQDYEKPLFYEDFITNGFGPSIPSVYYTYCGYGGAPITSTYPGAEIILPVEAIGCIDTIVEKYRDCKPWEFECFVRRNGGAWESTLHSKGLYQIIPIDEIATDCQMQKCSDDLER